MAALVFGCGGGEEGGDDGPPISDLAWRVLRTIYANPAGTQLNAIVLR